MTAPGTDQATPQTARQESTAWQPSLGPIGVVIPGYGHPQFLNEALRDVLSQTIADRLYVVIVDDGCPYPETAAVPRHAMATLDQTVYYIRQPNRKLPAARNAGVRFLLEAHPDIGAFFFLDADNRLAPFALERYEKALISNPEMGWAYPDIGFFGLTHNALGFEIKETAPDYSPLKHMMGNISEAGSLVRADVFHQGLFFDEDMQSGFEDWDFWLSALEQGWQGIRAEKSGFFYRRRPESMLSDSRREEAVLIDRLHAKHKQIFSIRSLMDQLHKDAPTYLLIDEAASRVHLTADPMQAGQRLTYDEARMLFARLAAAPREFFRPQVVIAASHLFWLSDETVTPHLRYCLWSLGEAVRARGPRVVHMNAGQHHVLQIRDSQSGIGTRNLVASGFDRFLEGLLRGDLAGQQLRQIHMLCPGYAMPRRAGFDSAKTDLDQQSWYERLAGDLEIPPANPVLGAHRDKRYAGPDSRKLQSVLLDPLMGTEDRLPYPYLAGQNPTLLCVLDEDRAQDAAFKDAVVKTMRWLKDQGFSLRLGIETALDGPMPALAEITAEVLDCVPLVRQKGIAEHRTYLGRRLQQDFSLRDKEQALILAQGVDSVICFGPCALQSLLGELKSFGIEGYVMAESPFMTQGDRIGAAAGRVLAFEHAEKGVVIRHEHERAAFAAEGIPPGKLIDPGRLVALIGEQAQKRAPRVRQDAE